MKNKNVMVIIGIIVICVCFIVSSNADTPVIGAATGSDVNTQIVNYVNALNLPGSYFSSTASNTVSYDGDQWVMGNADKSKFHVGGVAAATGTLSTLLGGGDFAHYYFAHNFSQNSAGLISAPDDTTSSSYVMLFSDNGKMNVYQAASGPTVTLNATPTFSLDMITGNMKTAGSFSSTSVTSNSIFLQDGGSLQKLMIGSQTPSYANAEIVHIEHSLADQLMVALKNTYGGATAAGAQYLLLDDIGYAGGIGISNSSWPDTFDGVSAHETFVASFGANATGGHPEYANLILLTQDAGTHISLKVNKTEMMRLTETGIQALGTLMTATTSTLSAGFRLPHGAAPTSPVDGDCWTTTNGLYCRINGITYGPYGTGGAGGISGQAIFTGMSTTRTYTLPNANAELLSKMGTTTNDNAAAGNIGEYIVSNITNTGMVSLSNNIRTDITSISLTAGDWEVQGVINYFINGANPTDMQSGSNTVSGTVGPDNTWINWVFSGSAITNTLSQAIPTVRYSLASPATVYLTGYIAYTGGTVQGYGRIQARRVR